MTFGSLFAGIGGFDLGLERAGMYCKWQCEIDPYARRVLAKHWPDVRRWDDVRTFPPPDGEWGVDLVCGGFPCQPIAAPGNRRGAEDERWLWPEFARVISILRPRYVLLENTTELLNQGFGSVLGDLAALGFDAEWSCISACSVGAPHTRQRLFVVANSDGFHGKAWLGDREIRRGEILKSHHRASTWANPERKPMETEAGDDRVVNGLSGRMVGLGGNAVVPVIPEWIGRRILEADGVM